jgi:hypothetical protein
LEVSLSLVDGQPLLWSANGKLQSIANATDRPLFVLNGNATTTSVGTQVNLAANPPVLNQIGNGYNSTAGPGGNQAVQQLGGFADVIPAQNGMGIWRVSFTPKFLNVVANGGGSATSIILPNSPNTWGANALVGGTLYCASTNQQLQITASSSVTAGNPITLTTVAPLGQPGATISSSGLTFSCTPLGRGMSGYKFDTSGGTVANSGYIPSQLGVGSADASGGFNTIFEIDLQNQFIFVIWS